MGWIRSLQFEKRVRTTALGILGLSLVGLSLLIASRVRAPTASVIRDWLPASTILVAYWQAGQFFTQANEQAQGMLIRFDQNLLQFLHNRFGSGIRCPSAYFEFAYLFCYPMIPLGVGALYLMHLQDHTDHLWAVVLPATYACYLVLPFLQILPPWMLKSHKTETRGALRGLNLWINRHLSIRVDTFPSAHVAASVSMALALLPVSPIVGLLFMWLAISIAIGSVARRYHYTLDVLLGAALALLAFLVRLSFED